MFHLHTPENVRKQKAFLTFSEGTVLYPEETWGNQFRLGDLEGDKSKALAGVIRLALRI